MVQSTSPYPAISSHFEPLLWQGCTIENATLVQNSNSKKYHSTDATAFEQYPHQTTSGRRELAASKDINSSCSASRLQKQRSPERTEVEPSLQKLTSHAPQYGPAVHDFQHRRHPSSASSHPSSPKSTSTLPFHADSSPPRESTFAIGFDVGNSPKTLTRNKIQIPPRTRYAPQHMSTAMSPDSNYFQQLDT